MDRFKDQLRRQIKFLVNSCKLFDDGDWEESIRIATCIRVLIHDTSKSTSLLKHLNAKDIKLFSTNPRFPEDSDDGYQCYVAFNMGVIALGKNNFGYMPNLEDFKPGASIVLPVEQWWEEIVWILSPECKLSRKRLILSAANQDGGAHVDAEVSQDYEYLTRYSAGTISLRVGNHSFSREVVKLHLVSIRTIANEVLKSADLLRLLE